MNNNAFKVLSTIFRTFDFAAPGNPVFVWPSQRYFRPMCSEKMDSFTSSVRLADVVNGVKFVNGIKEKRVAARFEIHNI